MRASNPRLDLFRTEVLVSFVGLFSCETAVRSGWAFHKLKQSLHRKETFSLPFEEFRAQLCLASGGYAG